MSTNSKGSLKTACVVGGDLVAVMIAYWTAFMLRFEFHITPPWSHILAQTLPLMMIGQMIAFYYFQLYNCLWQYASLPDLISIVKSVIVANAVLSGLILFWHHGAYPRSVLIIEPLILIFVLGSSRLTIRLSRIWRWPSSADQSRPRTLIVGEGDLAESALRFLQQSRQYRVVGILSEDRQHWRHRIHGVPVLGGRADAADIIRKFEVQEIVIATATTQRGAVLGELIALARRPDLRKLSFRVMPSLDEVLGRSHAMTGLRQVEPADLLNRDPIDLDKARIAETIQGRCVLVTGAGGTIGAELSRQILEYRPSRLVLIENSATNLFYLERELQSHSVPVTPLLADIRDSAMLQEVFERYRPGIVFHAAAHKHVFQLETNVKEGIKNNVIGTLGLARTAQAHGVERFVLISTDKAVNPTSAMGATKRLAEQIMQAESTEGSCRFMSVRFGNVLGSSGSVVPLFREQIARGGPLTVTHPDATRYFMTVHEAVQLILQASALGHGGETFILRMGTPVPIMDLARKMILMQGLEPETDIPIKISGLKPGEKLHEQLVEENEVTKMTAHELILVLGPRPIPMKQMRRDLEELRTLVYSTEDATLMAKIRQMVPTYQPSNPEDVPALRPDEPSLA